MSKSIIASLLIAALAACTTPIIYAQDDATPTMCSCSPTVFTFVLSLNQTCNDNDIEDNSGIDGSFCFTEEGVAVPEPPPPADDEADNTADPADSTRDALISDALSSLNIKATATTSGATIEYFGYEEDGPVRNRKLQSDDPVTEIVSVQFLEFDTSGDLTVINQDDTYADVTLMDGDKLKFNSASSFLDTSLPLSEQMSNPALVPGGASLILYGKTASGVVVRNRFFWMYDMNCGEENSPINVDDEIGWIKVDEIANAWPTFCPALPEGSPTIAPRSNEPTLTPSKSPTLKPSAMSIPPSPPTPTTSNDVIPNDSSVHHDQHTMSINFMAFSKSSKNTKTHKPAKASKGSSKSAKSAKSSKSSKGSKKYLNSQVVGYDVSSSVCTRSTLAAVMSVVMAAAVFLC